MASIVSREGFDVQVPQYEAPQLVELGGVVELTKGAAADDTADLKTAKFW